VCKYNSVLSGAVVAPVIALSGLYGAATSLEIDTVMLTAAATLNRKHTWYYFSMFRLLVISRQLPDQPVKTAMHSRMYRDNHTLDT
jgi:hypothetical protein